MKPDPPLQNPPAPWVGVFVGALALGVASTAGDLLWAGFGIRHRMLYGLIHGMALLAVLGVVLEWGIGGRVWVRGAVGGIAIGLTSALIYYATVPLAGRAALFIAWAGLWLLSSLFADRVDADVKPSSRTWLNRGIVAALASGTAFYLISDIWLSRAVANPNPLYNLLCWTFAFACGLVPLLLGRGRR